VRDLWELTTYALQTVMCRFLVILWYVFSTIECVLEAQARLDGRRRNTTTAEVSGSLLSSPGGGLTPASVWRRWLCRHVIHPTISPCKQRTRQTVAADQDAWPLGNAHYYIHCLTFGLTSLPASSFFEFIRALAASSRRGG
jgi:hypothetical protein